EDAVARGVVAALVEPARNVEGGRLRRRRGARQLLQGRAFGDADVRGDGLSRARDERVGGECERDDDGDADEQHRVDRLTRIQVPTPFGSSPAGSARLPQSRTKL